MDIIDDVFVYQMKEKKDLEWHGRVHSHGDGEFEVHYFIEGKGLFSNGKHTFSIEPGTLFVTVPKETHSIQATAESPVTYYAILIGISPDEEDGIGVFLRDAESRSPYAIGQNYRFYFAGIKEKGMSENALLRASACHQLFSLLYQSAAGGVDPSDSPSDDHHIERALRYMQRHVDDAIQLGDVASEVGINPSYLVRMFKKKLGQPPMRYYSMLRMEKAKAMLESGDASVKEIAYSLSYMSEFHFSKQFRKATGLSPRDYRKQYAGELRAKL